ncbi:P-loop containing nucleoside triphosphate hydrolase protein [Rhodotorula toruloides]|uniref:DNA helicase n=1 Tax=Rhodotorula toruloides TaxID=5286 RepID=A0A2T0A1A7_RHOTO|nr:P-loop containing nucleoside triphosphate hydrolase protein [Rhodotorula toruloides]
MAAAPPEEFLKRLVELTKTEQAAEEKESSLLFTNASVSLLERSGLALGNLSGQTSIGLGGRLLVELTRPAAYHSSPDFPPHDFRPGDLARLRPQGAAGGGARKATRGPSKEEKGKEKDDDALDAVVYRTTANRMVLAVDDPSDDFMLPERIQIIKVANPITFVRQCFFLNRALRKLEAAEPLSPLLSVLLGQQKPTIFQRSPDEPLSFINENLNASQKEAVDFALSSNEVALIWGPPGTGKTETLVEIIRQCVKADKRVLVCGASNLSVDNILARLSVSHPNFPQPIPLTRVGHPARVLSGLTRHTLDAQSSSTDSSALVEDIKKEIEELENKLRNGSGKTRIRGSERKKMWEEVRELRKEFRKRQGGIVSEVVSKAKVVLATTHGAGGRSLDRFEFDVVIIDEAAQATEPACWIPILKGKKLILVSHSVTQEVACAHFLLTSQAGDHLQLPPTLKSSDRLTKSLGSKSSKATSKEGTAPPAQPGKLTLSPDLEVTLFSRLLARHGPSIRRMLKVQYRFNAKINSFPSTMLYDGELVPDESVKDRKLSDLEGVEADEDLDEPVVFFDSTFGLTTPGLTCMDLLASRAAAGQAMYERAAEDGSFGSASKSNENEADVVHKYVQALVNANVPPTSISIISPYNSQVLLLASLIHPQYPEIEVGSVDSNQGRENDVVIVSLVRSNAEGEVGFLRELRRLNVSMTRPRRHLVVVGDSETVSKGSNFLKKWMEWLEEEALVKVP